MSPERCQSEVDKYRSNLQNWNVLPFDFENDTLISYFQLVSSLNSGQSAIVSSERVKYLERRNREYKNSLKSAKKALVPRPREYYSIKNPHFIIDLARIVAEVGSANAMPRILTLIYSKHWASMTLDKLHVGRVMLDKIEFSSSSKFHHSTFGFLNFQNIPKLKTCSEQIPIYWVRN